MQKKPNFSQGNDDERYCLPFNCRRPSLTNLALTPDAKTKLAALACFCSHVVETHNMPLLHDGNIKRQLRRLWSLANDFYGVLKPLMPSDEVIHEEYLWLEASENRHVIYDSYFNFVRYNENKTSPIVFLIEATRIVRDCALDLTIAPVSWDELAAFWRGTTTLIFSFTKELDIDLECDVVSDVPITCPEVIIDKDADYSLHRWKIHHASFALFCNAATTELSNASETDCLLSIQRATDFFRSTTTSMWFADTMSAIMYGTIVRPSMRSAKSPEGFTGRDNKDFAILSQEIGLWLESLKTKMLNAHTLHAAQTFAANYVEDAEAHVLLAIQKVGGQCSLTTEKLVEQYGAKNESAADMLRRIVERRKKQVEFLFK